MVKGTFVLSAHVPKTQQQRRRVHYRSGCIRYVVVLLAILVVFVYQYCFDNPSALEEYIEQNYQHKNHEELGQAKFNLLYALYSFPNIVIPLLGGYLIDKIGARIVFIITCGFCVLGQLIFALGGFYNMFIVMLAGRVVFGFGGQVLQGSQGTIISNWFKPHELSLILGICLAFPKIGSALNNYLTPILAQHYNKQDPNNYQNVGIPMLISFFAMCLGLVLTIVLAYIDKKSQKKQKLYHESALLSSGNQIKKKDISQITGSDYKKGSSVKIQVGSVYKQNQPIAAQNQHAQHINLKDIMKLPGSYWLLILVATLMQTLFLPFLDNGNKYYTDVFIGIQQPDQAGIYLVVPYLLGAILVPILGMFVDKVQKKSYLIILNSIFFLLTYLSMLYLQTDVPFRKQQWIRWLPVTFMGIGIGMFCSVVIPTLPMIVNPKLLGTAFGFMQMLQNLAIGAFPLIIGELRQSVQGHLEGFHLQTIFLFLTSCVCVGCAFLLKSVDMISGCKIDKKDFRKKYILQVLKQSVDVDQY